MKIIQLRFIHVLTFLLLSFLIVSCAANNAVRTEQQPHASQPYATKGILWKAEKPGIKPSFVFGTVHSEDERVTNLPDEINNPFSAAQTLVIEVLLDKKASQSVLRAMYFEDGRTLRSVTTEDIYKRAVEAMKTHDMPERLVNMMKPWAVFTVLNMPKQETGLFLDALLYQSAKKQGKQVLGLESMKEQMAVFDDMPMATQVSLLKSTLDSSEDMEKILNETIEVYLTHDLKKILDLNERYMVLLDKDVADEFNQRLIINRNKIMAERMLPALEKGNAFVAIGTLHLPGEFGVLNLLHKKGYRLTPVY